MDEAKIPDHCTSTAEPSIATVEVVQANFIEQATFKLKRLISWSIWFGAAAIAATFLLGAGMTMLTQSWLVEMARQHFAATIGLPFAALAAFAIVTILESSSGPLEFEGLSFKFKGASGPAVLWVLCFLAITAAIRTLW